MSTKGELSREQAAAIVGENAVDKLDNKNCDFTGRVQCDGDTRVEFAASVRAKDLAGDDVTLTAYYYVEQDDLDAIDDNDLSSLDWEIQGYDVV